MAACPAQDAWSALDNFGLTGICAAQPSAGSGILSLAMLADATTLVAALVVGYALLSQRLDRLWITAPMVFTGFGLVLGAQVCGLLDLGMDHEPVNLLAEMTLVLVLFGDASRIDLRALANQASLPVRLLAVGMPLTIGLGAVLARVLLPELSWLEALALGAVLAPTDAALGQAVVSSPVVPPRIRQTLNVESGLNDGIALPAVLLFTALASMGDESRSAGEWATFGILQVTLGPLAGVAVGGVGAWLLNRARPNDTVARVAGLGLAVLAWSFAEVIGGNGFISAFVAGMAFGHVGRSVVHPIHEFLEAEGQLLMMLVFLMFGANLVWPALSAATPGVLLYVGLSLTVVRMLPVAVSLLGSGVRGPTYWFLGWFGPRGLATVLFGMLVVEEGHMPHGELVQSVAMCVAAVSVVAHGVTAVPLSNLYGAAVTRDTEKCAEENQAVEEMPVRGGGIVGME